MTEWLIAIAALCSIRSTSDALVTDAIQAKCQAYYAKCLGPEYKGTVQIVDCVKERKP